MSINFDPAIEFYDATRGFPAGEEAHIGALFARAGGLTLQTRVLEIGIGTGRIALPTAPHVAAYYGIDLSSGMLGKLRGKQQGERIYTTRGDATRQPFPDGAFDAVIACHVFHLISAWQEAAKEVRRVLKPGGLLLHGWNNHLVDDQLEKVWDDAVADSPRDVGVERRGRDILDEFLAQQGWEKRGEEHTHAFTFWRSPAEYLDHMRNRRWSRCWRMTDDQIARGVAALESLIAQTHTDPTQPQQIAASFQVQVYAAP